MSSSRELYVWDSAPPVGAVMENIFTGALAKVEEVGKDHMGRQRVRLDCDSKGPAWAVGWTVDALFECWREATR